MRKMAKFIVRNRFIGFGFGQRMKFLLPFCMKETGERNYCVVMIKVQSSTFIYLFDFR